MPDFSVEEMSAYVDEDNKVSHAIYEDLCAAYHSSLEVYPEEVNLLGVYFFDILKLLTHSRLKERELEYGHAPSDPFVIRSLERWPYLGYEDIKYGCDPNSKMYGKGTSFRQRGFKQFLQSVVNLQYFLGMRAAAQVSLVSPRVDTRANLWMHSVGIKTSLIGVEHGWFSLPQLQDQLNLLGSLIAEVMAKNGHIISSDLINVLLRGHIMADCSEGYPDLQIRADLLLLKSGIELQNRMLAVTAKQQGLSVVNVMHGEAFGVYDDPLFSRYGETMYSNAILGYGGGVISTAKPYQYAMRDGIDYIASSGVNTLHHYSPEVSGVDFGFRKQTYYYFPTSLGGASHRYGPYRDAPDSLYISWQQQLFALFGGDIKIKAHPKEKYENSYPSFGVEVVKAGFGDVLDDIDVFVFDYIGTAFNIACATGKPVIYFDLGLRNTHPDALEALKKRTIYFDIREGVPSREEIEDRLVFGAMMNEYSQNYSLGDGRKNRAASLATGIKQLLSR